MKLSIALVSLLSALTLSHSVQARDTTHFFPIQEAMNTKDALKKLDSSIEFHFAKAPAYETSFEIFTINEVTSGFARSDERACQHVFLSSMIALQKRAKQLGANAVVDIQSYYDGKPYSHLEQYECHAGTFQVKVSLQGRMVVLEETGSVPVTASQGL